MKATRFTIRANRTNFDCVNVNDSKNVYSFASKVYSKNELASKEVMYALFVNSALNVSGFYKVSEGTITNVLFDVKAVCKCAINSLSSGVILIHNHPSGRTTPSEQDKVGTKRMKDALSLFDIRLLDHIILSGTDDNYLSFAECGLI